jgi:hypothetical protein
MYEQFLAKDLWTGEELACCWKATQVAIATRHADAVDVQFEVNGKFIWIALPTHAWREHKRRTGTTITDYLAVQIAGQYLKQIIAEGYDAGRELYTMSSEQVLEHLDKILEEARNQGTLPAVPIVI